MSAVAGANRCGGGAGAVKLSKSRARVGRALKRLGRGGDEVNENPTPPSFISLKRQPNSHFAIIANSSQNCFTCKSNFQYLNINNIRNKNYYN